MVPSWNRVIGERTLKTSRPTRILVTVAALAAIGVSLNSIQNWVRTPSLINESSRSFDQPTVAVDPPPLGLLPVVHPLDNQPTPAKIRLGQRLFFDKRLSRDHSLACSSCHDPGRGLSISERFATGVGGHKGNRHPPTLVNVAYNTLQFWDGRVGELGRADSLEHQVLVPIQDPHEMDLSLDEAVQRQQNDPLSRAEFQVAFGASPSAELIAKALAAFERTLLFGDAPFDRFKAGDATALSAAAKRGHDLFFWKATCSACHSGANFTDNAFHPSVATDSDLDIGREHRNATDARRIHHVVTDSVSDFGRERVTQDEADRRHFKTPTLREVHRRSPYMHDGSLATLEEVVERYDRGGFDTRYWPVENREKIERLMTSDEPDALSFRKNAAPQLRAGFPLKLTAEEKQDLVTFLREGLTSNSQPITLKEVPKP